MAAAAATSKQTATAVDRTLPLPLSSNAQNGTDTKMTGTGDDHSQTQSSIPSKRKSIDSEEGEEEAQEEQTQPTISKKKSSSSKPGTRFTLRNPPWAYLHLELVTQPTPSSSPQTPIDHLTARSYLTSALSQFLGLTGTSIPIDILKLDPDSTSARTSSLWIRVPHNDLAAITAALCSWIGGSSGGAGSSNVAFRVRAKGSWLGALVGGKGEDLFS